MPSNEAIADAFDDALTGKGGDAFVGVLAPGAVVWHNHDRQDVDARDNMAAVDMLSQLVDELANERRLFAPIDDGFVLQYVTRGKVRSSGKPFEMHNCLIVHTDADGLVTSIDEYVDPTVGGQLA
jgi:ketosteroid isomerase-like protein